MFIGAKEEKEEDIGMNFQEQGLPDSVPVAMCTSRLPVQRVEFG